MTTTCIIPANTPIHHQIHRNGRVTELRDTTSAPVEVLVFDRRPGGWIVESLDGELVLRVDPRHLVEIDRTPPNLAADLAALSLAHEALVDAIWTDGRLSTVQKMAEAQAAGRRYLAARRAAEEGRAPEPTPEPPAADKPASNVVPACVLDSRRAGVEAARAAEADEDCDDEDLAAIECDEILDIAPCWPLDGAAPTVMVRSDSDPNRVYSVLMDALGRPLSCTCDDFEYRQRRKAGSQCKHMRLATRCKAIWRGFDRLMDSASPTQIAASWRLRRSQGETVEEVAARVIAALEQKEARG